VAQKKFGGIAPECPPLTTGLMSGIIIQPVQRP